MGDLEDHPSVACTQLADLLKVVVFQLPHLLLLGQKGLQAFALLLVQLQLLQLLLQRLQVCPCTTMRETSDALIIHAVFMSPSTVSVCTLPKIHGVCMKNTHNIEFFYYIM